jgi:5-methylcytosine-specific restriction enzyme subunit McrC
MCKSFNVLEGKDSHHACGLGRISIFDTNGKTLNERIGDAIIGWFVD